MIAGARARNPMHVVALDMQQEKLELAKGCGADITINIAEQDAVAVCRRGVVPSTGQRIGVDRQDADPARRVVASVSSARRRASRLA